MTTNLSAAAAPVRPLTRDQITRRLTQCARLPSLSTINSALRELLNADQRYTKYVNSLVEVKR